MNNDVDELIELEVGLYVHYCRLACRRDEFELMYRKLAHKLFYHIQELRSTGQPSALGQVTWR